MCFGSLLVNGCSYSNVNIDCAGLSSGSSSDPCASAPCPGGQSCTAAPKTCITQPCPQFTCSPGATNGSSPSGGGGGGSSGKACTPGQLDIQACTPYFKDYFGEIDKWTTTHSLPAQSQYARVSRIRKSYFISTISFAQLR
jgi:hypothetical protein